MKGRVFSEETRKKMSESRKSAIDIYCSNGMHFTSWESIYDYLITNKLSSAKQISVCRQTIYTVLNKNDKNCYGFKWKTSPFINEEEKNINSKSCSDETKKKISQANRNKNEVVVCYNEELKL